MTFLPGNPPAKPHPLDSQVQTIGAIPPVGPTNQSDPPRSDASVLAIASQLRLTRQHAGNVSEAVGLITRLIMGMPSVVAMSHFHRDDEGKLTASSPLICKQSLSAQARKWEPTLMRAITNTVRKMAAHVEPIEGVPYQIVSVPTGTESTADSILSVFFDPGSIDICQATLLCQIAAAELGSYSNLTRANENESLHEFLQIAAHLHKSGAAYQHLANALESSLNVAQVILGSKTDGGPCRIEAASGITKIARPSRLVTIGEDVLSEAALQEELLSHEMQQPSGLSESTIQLAQLLSAGRILKGPLRDKSGATVGSWILVEDGTASTTPRSMPLLDQAQSLAPVAAGITALLRDATPGKMSKLFGGVRAAFLEKKKRTSLAIGSALLALLCLPWPYALRCDCELFTTQRRYVAAPYDGQLKEVFVKPGDLVTQGQLLAKMDRSELDWRIAAQSAEYERASKQFDSSTAQRETSSAQVAQLEMKRLGAERQLLRKRAENLEIKSPIDGVVLSGDPKKLEGARLTIGQTLFETGPLESILVELYIPHDEVTNFSVGDSATVRLDALPHRKLSGEILRISPQSESRDGKNVFVAEVELNNSANLLRPGMVGRGRVKTSVHLLGWNLFHKPFARLIRLLRW